MASWRTFVAALIGVLGIVFSQLGYGLDDDPATTTNWDTIMKSIGTLLSIAGMGGLGFFARDDKVTSAQAKASDKT